MMTTKQLKRIRDLHAEGQNDVQIAAEIGMPITTTRRWRSQLGLPAHRGSQRVSYTIYDRKTDQYLVEGDAKTCAAYIGKSLNSFYSSVSKARHHGLRGKYIYEVNDYGG